MARIIRRCHASAWAVLLLAVPWVQAAAIGVIDDTGRPLQLPHPVQRIVSLAPGATEMLFAAGAGSKLLATVAYSDEPAAARQLPRIGDSSAIDMERLLALKPDVVVFWPGGNNPAQIAQLRRLGFTLYGQQVDRLSDLGASLRRLGLMTGTASIARQRALEIDGQLAELHERYSRRPALSAFLETWNQPLYTVGGRHLLSDALSLCGAVNLFGDLPQLSPAVQPEAVITRNPDAIIAAAPPGQGARWLQVWRAYPALKAVSRGILLDFQDQALSRLGPSVVDATRHLCEQIDAARTHR